MKKLILGIILGLVVCTVLISQALAFDNGGFETGDLGIWSVQGENFAEVVELHETLKPSSYGPEEGDFFAKLYSGNADESGIRLATLVTQSFSLLAGGEISGSAAFDTWDYIDSSLGDDTFNDSAWVKIYQGTTQVGMPWFKNVAAVDDNGSSDWESWSWTSLTGGNYLLELGVINGGWETGAPEADNYTPSYALFDNIETTPVPEPISSVLFLLGAGAFGLRRFRNNKV